MSLVTLADDILPRFDGNRACLGLAYLLVIGSGLICLSDPVLSVIWLVALTACLAVNRSWLRETRSPETESEAQPPR